MANRSLRFYRDVPLKPGSLESRVLRLSPGTEGDPISATVDKLDLANLAQPYSTLSYTWGDAEVTKPVTVNGEVFQATVNLYDALQHVRSVDTPILIWVDAICINQWDLAEKSSQVSFMAELYKQCDKVYVWLGRPAHPGELKCSPFALLEHFRDGKHCQDLPGYHREPQTGAWTCDTEDAGYRALWDSLAYVARSPWWSRAWTVQELILPPVAIVMYGKFSISWTDITVSRVTRNAHFYTYSDDCCGFSHEAIPRKDIQPFDVVLASVEELETTRLRNGHFKTFQEIERGFASRKCQDPRDKIWSLLSFSPSSASDYPVDYTTPVSQVFFNAFRTMLTESGGSLQCLLGHGFNTKELDLPSWARNFTDVPASRSLNYLQNRRVWAVYPLFNACGGRDASAVLVGAGELHLQGVRLDQVSAVGKACEDFWIDDLKSLMDDWYELCRREGISFTRDVLDDKIARVLCNDVVDDPADHTIGLWRFVRNGYADLPSDSQWSSFLDTGDPWALPRKFRGSVDTAVAGRVLYSTKERRIGLANPSIQPGDEIWAIDGSRIPFVLRPSPGGSSNLRLICETYLHGVMHGEEIVESVGSAKVILV